MLPELIFGNIALGLLLGGVGWVVALVWAYTKPVLVVIAGDASSQQVGQAVQACARDQDGGEGVQRMRPMRIGWGYYPIAVHSKSGRQFGLAILSWPIRDDRKILLPGSNRYNFIGGSGYELLMPWVGMFRLNFGFQDENRGSRRNLREGGNAAPTCSLAAKL